MGVRTLAMLTDHQIDRVWQNMLGAETRALYFGDLAASYTRRKQWITGVSFFCSSGAAAAIVARAPTWVPLLLSVIVAVNAAYAMAVNLEARIATMAKLHAAWAALAASYDQLWNHVRDDGAEEQFEQLVAREREASELAVSSAPYDEQRMGKWQDRVIAMYHLDRAA